MEKIYITTAHTGYNYGTYLQAYAMKKFLIHFADNAEIVWEKSFGPKGRDFRIKKMISLAVRSVLHYRQFSSIKQGYEKNFAAEPSDTTKQLFDEFSEKYLAIKEYSHRELVKLAANSQTKAVVCGSDQIWNASSMYPDPLYYLQFVPKSKRVAFAPSFGRATIPEYNRRLIKKYINTIPAISVREDAGVEIVNELTGRNVPVMPDPTLLVDWSEWIGEKKEDYLLIYFLDEPSQDVIDEIVFIQKNTPWKVKVLLHAFESYSRFFDFEVVDAGPREFVNIISRAKFICTDSFHASIFAMLTHTLFFTYERNYGKVDNQSSRIETLLKHYKMMNRLRKQPGSYDDIELDCSFVEIDEIRKKDIDCATDYLKAALLRR